MILEVFIDRNGEYKGEMFRRHTRQEKDKLILLYEEVLKANLVAWIFYRLNKSEKKTTKTKTKQTCGQLGSWRWRLWRRL